MMRYDDCAMIDAVGRAQKETEISDVFSFFVLSIEKLKFEYTCRRKRAFVDFFRLVILFTIGAGHFRESASSHADKIMNERVNHAIIIRLKICIRTMHHKSTKKKMQYLTRVSRKLRKNKGLQRRTLTMELCDVMYLHTTCHIDPFVFE